MSRGVMFRSGLLLFALAAALHAAPVFQVVRAFTPPPYSPRGGLLLASDGNYYGVGNSGGGAGEGGIFRIDPSGVVSTVASFEGYGGTNGGFPEGNLIEGPDGALYGISMLAPGGDGTDGGAFRYTPATGLQSLAVFPSFQVSPATIHSANGELARDSDGNLYGKSSGGGTANLGSLFKIAPAGVATVLHSFDTFQSSDFRSGLTRGQDGSFYGTCRTSAAGEAQVFFRLDTDGTFVSVADLSPVLGDSVFLASLTLGPDGNFYGITGSREGGSFVRITPAGAATVMGSVNGIGEGQIPPLTLGPDGNFYGVSTGLTLRLSGVPGCIFRITPGGAVTVLHSFAMDDGHGFNPAGPLTLGTDGQLHGVTSYLQFPSYTEPYIPDRCLTPGAFKISTSGVFTFIRSFGTDNPLLSAAALLPEKTGGFIACFGLGGDRGYGGVARLQPDGTASFLLSYDSTTGWESTGGLVLGRDRNYYGTTDTHGTYYRLAPDGRFTALADLSNFAPGPYVPLQTGKDGNFYTFGYYGSNPAVGSDPVIFKFTPRGAISVLADFGTSDEESVEGTPLPGRDGSLYMQTYSYGDAPSRILRVKRNGDISTFTTFPQSQKPWSNLIAGPDGALYGFSSPDDGYSGSFFKVDSSGRLTILFDTLPDLLGPGGGMVLAADGFFYGISQNRAADAGVIFRISPAGEFLKIHQLPRNSYLDGKLVQGADGHLYGASIGFFYRLYLGAAFETGPATDITWNGATLHATVDPAGGATTVSFQYSTEPSFRRPQTVRAGKLAADTDPTDVSAAARLQPGRTYWFRAVTTSSENPKPQMGDALSFTTPPRPVRAGIQFPSWF